MQYEIKGTPFPVAICTLSNGESLITERGSMSWMSDAMEMKTVGGSVGKALGRMFSGESLFQNKYTAHKDGAFIAFASSFPGEIKALDIRPGSDIIVQKSGFLASEEMIRQLAANGQIATQYVDLGGQATNDVHFNPNGSAYAIEGITSPDGRIFGKMGHSERIGSGLYRNVPGEYFMNMFESGIRYFK